MSEPDKYYEQARSLVTHCRYCDRDYKCPEDVEQDRQDVAARLRVDGQEIDGLRIEIASLKTAQPGAEQNYYFMLQGAKQEIDKLKAELAQLRAQLANRCDYCGAKVYFGPPDCGRCGAPQCCPQCCEIDTLRAQLAAQQNMVDLYAAGEAEAKREAIELRRQMAALTEDRDTHKRIAERNHKANLMPCPQCGHVQDTIHAAGMGSADVLGEAERRGMEKAIEIARTLKFPTQFEAAYPVLYQKFMKADEDVFDLADAIIEAIRAAMSQAKGER